MGRVSPNHFPNGGEESKVSLEGEPDLQEALFNRAIRFGTLLIRDHVVEKRGVRTGVAGNEIDLIVVDIGSDQNLHSAHS